MLPLAMMLYDRKQNNSRLLKIEQEYVPRDEIEEFIDSRTSHLEDGIRSLDVKVGQVSTQITEMRIEFARWQERLENRSKD